MLAWEKVLYRTARSHATRVVATAPPSTFMGRTIDNRTYRAATALYFFNRALNEILPRAGGGGGGRTETM